MLVTLNFAVTQVITRANKAQTTRLRSTEAIVVGDDTIDPADNGYADLDLTAEQSAALAAIIANPEALAEAAESGSLTLPDGGHRGKPLASGPTLASFVVQPEANAKAK